jgi:hypothetical protein
MDNSDRLKPAGEAIKRPENLFAAAKKAGQTAQSQRSGKEAGSRPLPSASRPGMS